MLVPASASKLGAPATVAIGTSRSLGVPADSGADACFILVKSIIERNRLMG